MLAVYASTAHWDRVRDCLQLTPAQTVSLQQLLASLQAAHATCSRQRSQLLQALQQQYMATLGWQGTAAYPSCYMAAGAAAVTDALLADISDSIAGDCGILLEGSSFLWGPQVGCVVMKLVFVRACVFVGSQVIGGAHKDKVVCCAC